MEKPQNYLSRLRRHPLLWNLALIAAIILAMAVAAHILMQLGTRHGARRTVPDLSGVQLDQAQRIARKHDLQLHINDSLFVPAYEGGIVLDQLPEGGVEVKPGRTVYITINSSRQKMVPVPYVAGRSLRQAKNMLEIAGLEIAELVYRADMATNYVLEEYCEGKPVTPTTRMEAEMGSGVTLYVGVEEGYGTTIVPRLVGLPLAQAKGRLWELGLNVGRVDFDEGVNLLNLKDTRVYIQTPGAERSAALGSKVDLRLTLDEKKLARYRAEAEKQAAVAAEERRAEEQQRADSLARTVLEAVPADAEDEEEAGLYEHFAVTADKGQTPMRLDKFLTVRMEHCSRNRIQAAADSGNILVNGKAAKSSYKVKPLDRIQIVMPYPRREVELVAEDIPLDIPYEDQWLLLVDKPAGLVVHPGVGNYSGTLVNALMHHLNKQGIPAEEQNRAGLVHRIDKNTSGLLVIAKDEQTHARLAKQFFDHTIQRRYVALVWGNFDEDEGTITGNIGRSPKDRQKMFVFADGSDGKHAVTHWKVLKRYGYVTLVECRLETGRTHQIRVHMAWIGHPLFNDERYGGDRILKGTTFAKYRQFIENCFAVMPRHALHARLLGFEHPATHENVLFESPLPADFQSLLTKWNIYTSAAKETKEN